MEKCLCVRFNKKGIPCKIAQNNVFKVQGLIVSSGEILTAATILKKNHTIHDQNWLTLHYN